MCCENIKGWSLIYFFEINVLSNDDDDNNNCIIIVAGEEEEDKTGNKNPRESSRRN